MSTIEAPRGFSLASVTIPADTRAQAFFAPLPTVEAVARAIDPAAFTGDDSRDMNTRRGMAEGAAMRVLGLFA